MNTQNLIKALSRMKVQTGSLVCIGCGHEHNCGVHGCAIIREAAAQLHGLYTALDYETQQRKAAVQQLRQMADCETCKHVDHCSEGCESHIACNMGQNWEWDGGNKYETD